MIGTWFNIITIIIGGFLGMFLGNRLPERLRQTIMAGLGLFTLAFGLSLFLKSANILIVLGSVLFGAILGEWWQLENALRQVGVWLEKRFATKTDDLNENKFIKGFLTASLLFCVGPMAILGSIQDGLTGDYSTLAVKAILDGFASLAFASSLGIGVLFSTITVLLYQGGLTLLAAQVQAVVTTPMMNEMTATGGVILIGIAISSLLEIKQIHAGNFLPALVIAPLLTVLFTMLGLY